MRRVSVFFYVYVVFLVFNGYCLIVCSQNRYKMAFQYRQCHDNCLDWYFEKKHKRGFILKNISLYRNEPHVSLVMQEVSWKTSSNCSIVFRLHLILINSIVTKRSYGTFNLSTTVSQKDVCLAEQDVQTCMYMLSHSVSTGVVNSIIVNKSTKVFPQYRNQTI